ncbi:hypothetical protein P3X46_026917 [Hevea brasiliensis]|uniref:Uncharacterized protein n=1 Tax=Hevea brasiliensis TaxID=3981 RepID=A0ABQ9KZL6_HEVBR|nr:hypothetical protein P3X46_026917 [Hevea brasiliensis]
MARSSAAIFVFVLVVICHVLPCFEGRKLLPSLKDNSTAWSALLKGCHTPISSPSDKGHAMDVYDERLIASHLSKIDRISGSVPSPGAGH